MGLKEFSLVPKDYPKVETPYRSIKTALPVPESVDFFKKLWASEPISMRCEPPVLWHRSSGLNVFDPYGNKWLDWSCGVLVTSVGHNHPAIREAISKHLQSGAPLHTYIFANEARARLTQKILAITPSEHDRVFLLTTGSEAVEVSLKVARTYGVRRNPKKRYVISYQGAFHGRTYASQLAGGGLGGGEWVDPNPTFVQVPYPGSIDTRDKSFGLFEKSLAAAGIKPEEVAAVIAETFQGREAKLMPVDYVKSLRQWCDRYDAALIFDEVQAGFGRTGRLFGFEHYGVVPDLFVCGKGISSSLPLSAVIGKSKYLDLYKPGEMTSTHTGSPIPCVAALASIETLHSEKLVENCAAMGAYLKGELEKMVKPYSDRLDIGGVGLVYGLLFFNNRQELMPDPETAFRFCEEAVGSGNLFFAPVGKGRGAIKFCPPLSVTREAIDDGLYGKRGLAEILKEVMEGRLNLNEHANRGRNMRELKAFLESRRDEAAGLLAELIRFKSVAGEGEDEIQRFLAEKFRSLGLDVSLELVPESIKEHPAYTRADHELDYSRRPNLFAAWKGSGPQSVILCAHSDVVPAGDWTEAFNPVIKNGRVIGRGAADDKGHIVSIYYALLALKELGRQPKKSVEVQLVVEEETGGNGALAAILTGHRADGVIVMESTDLSICPANRGAVWYKIEVQGIPVHMGRIREGVNAVEKMAEVMHSLRQYETKLIAESNHPLFREYEQPVQVNIGMIKGGDWPAMVAGWAEMEGGVGFLPTKSLEDVQKELTALLQNHPDPWVREHSKVSFPKLHNDAYETKLDDPLVTGLKESAIAAGAAGKVTGLIVSCDARLYAKVGKMPTVVFGPDSIKQAHSREESISIDEMIKASEIVARYLLA